MFSMGGTEGGLTEESKDGLGGLEIKLSSASSDSQMFFCLRRCARLGLRDASGLRPSLAMIANLVGLKLLMRMFLSAEHSSLRRKRNSLEFRQKLIAC